MTIEQPNADKQRRADEKIDEAAGSFAAKPVRTIVGNRP